MRPSFWFYIFLLSFLQAAAFAQNVPNAGFETGAPGAWQTWVFGSTGSVSVGTVARSGNYGLVQGPNNGREVAYQDLHGLTPGQTYRLSAYVRSSASGSAPVSLAVHDTQGNGWIMQTFNAGTIWQQISLPYTVSSNGAMRIHLYAEVGSITTYWDDVSVLPANPSGGSLSPTLPLSEYIYLNGKAIAVEHSPH